MQCREGAAGETRPFYRCDHRGLQVSVPTSAVIRRPAGRADGRPEPDWIDRLLYDVPMGAREVGVRVVACQITRELERRLRDDA